MTTFAVLSVTLAVAILAVTAVVGYRLVRTVAAMASEVRRSAQRLGPLTVELQDELAVTQTESGQLQQRVGQMRDRRRP